MKSIVYLLLFAVVLTLKASVGEATHAPLPVTFIPSDKVAAAFSKGIPLLENSAFKVHASRREGPGVAEIHTLDTDVIYVMEGSATLVTGGSAVAPKTIAPNEIRGKEINGGESRRIAKGDVIVIPNGVPHWFKQVEGPLLYYVVKVTSSLPAGQETAGMTGSNQ